MQSTITAMHIVLVNPEIPQNTGSIARTCAATNTPLHLVGDLGFDISEKAVRRAGLDYWPWVQLSQYKNWEEFISTCSPRRLWFFTKFAGKSYFQADFASEDYLVFGSETKGLGKEFLDRFNPETLLRIPIANENVRSLNLSNAVSIGLYEALRQTSE